MVCNKLAFLAFAMFLAWSGVASAQQQPQNFGNGNQTPLSHQQGLDQHFKNFQPGFGKNGNSLDMNNDNMKFQHVKYSGAPGSSPQQRQPQPQQQPQQFANIGMGTQGTQQPQPGTGNRVPVRGGGGVSGGPVNGGGPGNGQFNGNGRLPVPVRNGNGRPMEQAGQTPSQPQQATFVPPGPMATISFGSSQAVPAQQAQSPATSPAHFTASNNGQGKGTQEWQAKGQANSHQFTAFPQSNSNGLSVHNPNLPSTLAKNTFGVPSLNSWNPQPHLAGETLNGNGNGNRFKISSIQPNSDRDAKFSQNALDSNAKFNSLQGPKENSGAGVGGFKFPVDDAPVQDNRFGPFNDGFGNTGSASTMTTVNFGTGIGGAGPNIKGKGKNNTLKKGKFSWVSPEGQVYEISYVADLKESAANSPAAQSPPEDSGFYKSAFPYPATSVSIGMAEPPRNSLELYGSASAPSDYLVHANSRTQFQPYGSGNQNMFTMPPQQQRFLPGRGF